MAFNWGIKAGGLNLGCTAVAVKTKMASPKQNGRQKNEFSPTENQEEEVVGRKKDGYF